MVSEKSFLAEVEQCFFGRMTCNALCYINMRLAEVTSINESIIAGEIAQLMLMDKKSWVGRSCDEWPERFRLFSERTVQRTLLSLERKGIILSKIWHKSDMVRCKLYTINVEKLKQIMGEI